MTNFYSDRDERGKPGELLLIQLLKLRGIEAHINPAPEEDYEGRAAYDLEVAGELWEAKTDWMSWTTGNLCVEAAALIHTHAIKFAYLTPTPSGFYIHIFDTKELIDLYNAQDKVSRGDGTFSSRYTYPHKRVGDQSGNDAVLLPRDITDTVGRPLWKEARFLTEQTTWPSSGQK